MPNEIFTAVCKGRKDVETPEEEDGGGGRREGGVEEDECRTTGC